MKISIRVALVFLLLWTATAATEERFAVLEFFTCLGLNTYLRLLHLFQLKKVLKGNHQTLFAKSALDGITSIILASTFGIGCMFSSIPLFFYQGTLTMAAVLVKPFLQPEVVAQMSSVGGVLIMAIGINLLGVAKIRIGSMLPAVFLPMIWYMITRFFL